ncbi:amidohydrolase family protein [Rubrimonas cliftonensis]|uniref:L-fuconolactonase n=1 Tax=Rubrimonas cliftonensis TaxID=89524 RepID=A0A1H4CDK5_9RHOB|nr:amidohydrolase family protein [Rubrimonas cliftonensis]SEA58418.1 L-fuconolactonase [Rubrimonas cliftonensis]
MRVDAHQHYWNPVRGDYGWMPADDPVLSRDYGPAELQPQLDAGRIDATVLVQAAPTVAETEHLLGIADATPHVKAVVGWVDFEQPAALADLRRLSGHAALRGVRPMIQDIPDDAWMLREDHVWAFRALCDLGLRFDALGFPRHLPHFLTLLRRWPDLPAVVDHCMKPQIALDPGGFDAWAEGMARIAGETGAFCKLSGLVTEAAPGWTIDDLRPYAAHVLSVFGPERVMWGSDWPVVRLRAEHGDWLAAAEALTAGLSEPDRARVFGGTAAAFYGLG